MRVSIGAMFVVAVLGLGGCGKSGGKCEQAIDKAMKMAGDMMAAMAGDKAGEMKAEMEKEKPAAIKKCEEALKNDKDGKMAKALDCIVDAKDMEAMSKCEGADAVMQ